MAYTVNKETIGVYPANAADIGANIAVRIDAGEIKKPTAGGQCIGINTSSTNAAGEAVTVQTSGIAKIVCAASIATGALVTVNTDGKASAAATTDEYVLGKILEVGANGKVVPILLIKDQQVNGPNP